MKFFTLKWVLFVLVGSALAVIQVPVIAGGTVTYSHDPSEAFVSPGLSFFTTLRVTGTDKTAGALSILLKYDTKILQIQQVVPVADSLFGNNLFADTSSFQSGSTRIVAFQTSTITTAPKGEAVCRIVWRTLGNSSSVARITNVVEKHISSAWATEQVWAIPATAHIDSTDSDGDGLPDWWETLYYGSATAAKRDADDDGDGYTNLQEFLAGTSPLDPAQVLRIVTMEIVEAGIRITFPTLLAKSYQVESSDDLSTSTWSAIGGIVIGSGKNETRLDSDGLAHPLRFYRVRIVN